MCQVFPGGKTVTIESYHAVTNIPLDARDRSGPSTRDEGLSEYLGGVLGAATG